MAKSPNVNARFSELDKQCLIELAAHFQRSQSDTLRVLVRESVAVLREQGVKLQQQKTNRPVTRRAKSKNLK